MKETIGKTRGAKGLTSTFSTTQEQIDDLAAMSREYEKQEALRMTQNASNAGNDPSRHSEPYINELIPVDPARARRREPDPRGGR
ncbi:hypothetical protein N7468_004101 [Penicillium chermesinum]|uniref:Uncharacterized protein n=1 Tax=Penicillium chermesinum TaxID=63820 RepID=A0A9W9TSF3_9EURO|nr:uncharacterized protein N7468_004101 [Penicillium chermesinum]KAJ5239482.1 hypothetical protein N7468_004101 [Penicillium chermesinum]